MDSKFNPKCVGIFLNTDMTHTYWHENEKDKDGVEAPVGIFADGTIKNPTSCYAHIFNVNKYKRWLKYKSLLDADDSIYSITIKFDDLMTKSPPFFSGGFVYRDFVDLNHEGESMPISAYLNDVGNVFISSIEEAMNFPYISVRGEVILDRIGVVFAGKIKHNETVTLKSETLSWHVLETIFKTKNLI